MNKYGVEFKNLVESNDFSNLFSEEKYIINNKIFTVLKFNVDKKLVNHCLDIAKEKSNYTMALNQNLEERTDEQKFINAFRGILAETLVHLFLLKKCDLDFSRVKRFDLERASFEYSPEEYDINIIKGEEELRLECRSSSSWCANIKKACETKPIIGQYINSTKSSESISDLYSCVLFQYDTDYFRKNKIYKDKDKTKLNTIQDILDGNLLVYLPSGTNVEQMTGVDSRRDNYGQKNTEYNLVDISKAGDIKSYIKKVKEKTEEA